MCINFGASDYITKPITLEYLETVLTMKLLEV
jgi:DNA-binding response OmpR family regulator